MERTKMLDKSVTPNDLFEAWKRNGDSAIETYREHRYKLQSLTLKDLVENGYFIVPIVPKDKKPLKGYKWKNQGSLTIDKGLEYYSKKCNLAIVSGYSSIIVLDWDNKNIPEFLQQFIFRTKSVNTPRGLHLHFRVTKKLMEDDFNKVRFLLEPDRRKAAVSEWSKGIGDMFRFSIQYALIPYSVVRQEDKTFKVYDWINKGELMNWENFIKEVDENVSI